MDAINAYALDQFDRGLDDGTRGRSADLEFDSGAELDRLLDAAEAMRALDAADWSAEPDPAFLHRLKEQLDMNAHASTAPAQRPVIGPSRRLTWGARAPQTRKRNGGFAVLELLAASLLIFMFAGVAYNAGAFNRFMPSVATPIPAVTTNATGNYRGNAGRTGVLTGSGPTGAPTLAWKNPVFAAIGNPPVVAGDRVYFIEQDPTSRLSFVTCIDVKTGEKIWSSQVDAYSTSAPAVGANLVFVTTGNALFALNADTGARAWRYDGDGTVDPGAPAFANGIVYFTTRNLWLRAVNAATGKEAWRTVLPYAAVGDAKTVDSGDRAFAAPSVSGGIVIAMGGNSFVMAADATTGKELWRRQVGDAAYPPKTLVMSDGAVYFGAAVSDPPQTGTPAPGESIYVRGILLALDARTGDVRWSQEGVPPPNGLAIDNGVLLVAQGAVINAMDASTGKELWWFGVSGVSYEPTVAGDVVYVRALNGRLYGLNEKTGARVWEAFVGASGDPIVANGTVIVIGARSIYAISGDASATAPYSGDPKLDVSGLPACLPWRSNVSPSVSGTPSATLTLPSRAPTSPGALFNQVLVSNVPKGAPADAVQQTGIQATLQRMSDCSARLEPLATLNGFYTDDFYRRLPKNTDEVRGAAGTGFYAGGTFEITSTAVLADGRVAVVIMLGPQYGTLLIFAEQDGHWLIDEQYTVLTAYTTGNGG